MPPVASNASAFDDAILPARTSLGLVSYSLLIQQRAAVARPELPNLADPFHFLKRAHELGASGMQVYLDPKLMESAGAVRKMAEESAMFVEGTVALPRASEELERFDRDLEAAAAFGAKVARCVCIPGRRYEQFGTLEEFKKAVAQARASLELAEPVARKRRVVLAVENHKDQRTGERLKLLESISSEWIGACLDVGNNLALLEDPVATTQAFLPWIRSVHFKDQGLAECDGGFLLADVPLGQGAIDLRAILELLREKAPGARLHLELITRDALRVPALTEGYWATLAEVHARALGEMLGRLKERRGVTEFANVSGRSAAEQITLENEQVQESLRYAATELKLT